MHKWSQGHQSYDAGPMDEEELVLWLSLPEEERQEVHRSCQSARWEEFHAAERAQRQEEWRAAGVKHSDSCRVATEKLDAYKAELRSEAAARWREKYARRQRKRHVGCDTRRYRADGKMLGNHHGRWRDDVSHWDRVSQRERRVGEYVRRCYERGFDDDRVYMRAVAFSDWDERCPKLNF